jgi:tRNA wybutosine-synthesizing protein 4
MQAADPLVDRQNEVASIGTNSYSIVSKRSVEKLYHSNDPPFLKPFVPKFKRRAPLINRGYWLRTKAIENAVEIFLHRHVDRPKAIVNLGCGYDPLPFRMKYKQLAADAKFIDVDYTALVRQKLAIINKDDLLNPYVSKEWQTLDYGDAQITDFGWYCAVGCDLGDLETMSRVFEDVVDIVDCEILFLAEVSITYMPLQKADNLLQWTASHEHG